MHLKLRALLRGKTHQFRDLHEVMAKANEAGIQLTPELLFEYQTIAELVAMYDTLGLSQSKMQ